MMCALEDDLCDGQQVRLACMQLVVVRANLPAIGPNHVVGDNKFELIDSPSVVVPTIPTVNATDAPQLRCNERLIECAGRSLRGSCTRLAHN